MEALLLPAVVVGIAGAFGGILWYLFTNAAQPTPFDDDTDESDGNEKSSKSRGKKRSYQLRKRPKAPVEEESRPTASLEERTRQQAAPQHKKSPPAPKSTEVKPAPERKAEAKPGLVAPGGRARKVSFSDSATAETGQETSSPVVVPSASSNNGVAAPSSSPAASKSSASTGATASKPQEKTKPAAKPSPQTKAKAQTKVKSRATASSSGPTTVKDLASAIEVANLSSSDAQELVEVLLIVSSGESQWTSRGAHGRSEETLDTVKRSRDELAARLEEERASNRNALESLKSKRAAVQEDSRQLKVKNEALEAALAGKTKDVVAQTARLRTLEDDLAAKPEPVGNEDVRRFRDENVRLKSELDTAHTRLADTIAESNGAQKATRAAESSLNNQLQQAKANAERLQKRTKELEKQVQAGGSGQESSALAADNAALQMKIAEFEARQSQQAATSEKVKSDELAALEAAKAKDLAELASSKSEELSALEANFSEKISALEKSNQGLAAELETAKASTVSDSANDASPSVDPSELAAKTEEIEKLKQDVESLKGANRKIDGMLKASNAKNADLRDSNWRAKDEASLAKKNAQAEVKKSIDGFKARQRDDAATERDQITAKLGSLYPSVEVSSDSKTLSAWVDSFVGKASEEKVAAAAAVPAAAPAETSSETTEELERTRERLKAVEEEVDTWKTSCEEAQSVLAQTNGTLNSIEAQVEAEDTKQMGRLRGLEEELDRAEASKKIAQEELEKVTKDSKECSETHQKQINELKKQLEQSKNVNDDMQKFLQQASTRQDSQLNEVTEKFRRSEAHLTTFKSRVTEAERNTASAEAALAKSQIELDESTSRLDQVRKDLEAAVAEKESLQGDCAASRKKCIELENDLKVARDDVESANTDKKNLSEDVDQMIQRLSEVRLAMSKLEVEKQELARQLRDVLDASASASTDV